MNKYRIKSLAAVRAPGIAILLALVSSSAPAQRREIPPNFPRQVSDYLSGVWIVDPACQADKSQLPSSVSITLRSRDVATGKRTYHVSFTLPYGQLGIPSATLAVDQDVITGSNTILSVMRQLAPYRPEAIGVQFESWVGAPSYKPGQLHVRLFLYALVGAWEPSNACPIYVLQKPAP